MNCKKHKNHTSYCPWCDNEMSNRRALAGCCLGVAFQMIVTAGDGAEKSMIDQKMTLQEGIAKIAVQLADAIDDELRK